MGLSGGGDGAAGSGQGGGGRALLVHLGNFVLLCVRSRSAIVLKGKLRCFKWVEFVWYIGEWPSNLSLRPEDLGCCCLGEKSSSHVPFILTEMTEKCTFVSALYQKWFLKSFLAIAIKVLNSSKSKMFCRSCATGAVRHPVGSSFPWGG